MLRFEEELKKFQPMKDVDQLEEVILQADGSDLTDLMQEMLSELKNSEMNLLQTLKEE